MKRTRLSRKTRLQTRTPLKRGDSRLERGPMRKVNRKRKAKLHARNFGDYASVIRALPCDTCGAAPPSHPHHAKSRGAGGTKRHLIPTCRTCHRLIHDGHGPSRQTLMERARHYWETYGDASER